MADAVQQFDGTVSRKMGDGLMALFGAPVAHEDHAVRACFAALAMLEGVSSYAEEVRQAHGAEIQIRVGLNSGGVIVRDLSDDRHQDYTAMGPTVHLASRMEQLATPGTALLGPATRALVEGFVDVRPLGAREVKGFDRPVEVFDLVGVGAARTRLQVTAARGLTPFVGRDDERAAIDRALARAQAGQGQVVALVPRPASASRGWSGRRSGLTAWTDGACSRPAPSRTARRRPGCPSIDLLRTYFQIESRDDHAAMRDKVPAGLHALDPALEPDAAGPARAPRRAGRGRHLGAALDPAQRRRATLDAVGSSCCVRVDGSRCCWCSKISTGSTRRPRRSSTAWSRPSDGAHPAAGQLQTRVHPRLGQKSYYTQLRLDPLGDRSAEELLGALLGSDSSIRPLAALLIERTEGTPLFLEESVRSLVETGALVGERGAYRLAQPVAEIGCRRRSRAVLAARIDRLEPGRSGCSRRPP